jgi:hypothetical protein
MEALKNPWRRYGMAASIAAFCCAVFVSGAAFAQISWKRVGTVTTLTNGQLCKNDGTNIVCDSTTPTISGGNVGIGTTAPSTALNISSSTNQTSLRLETTNSSAYNTVLYSKYLSTNSGGLCFGAAAPDDCTDADGIQFHNDGTPLKIAGYYGVEFSRTQGSTAQMHIDGSTGHVGIGTTSPAYSLDVSSGDINTNNFLRVTVWPGYGSGFAEFWFNGNNPSYPANTLIEDSGKNLQLASGNLYVGGSIGIGTTAPATGIKADINGVVKVAGAGSEACSASTVGAIRYNAAGNYMEVCSYP